MSCGMVGLIGGSQVYTGAICSLTGVTEIVYLNRYRVGLQNPSRNAQLLQLDQLGFKLVPRVV